MNGLRMSAWFARSGRDERCVGARWQALAAAVTVGRRLLADGFDLMLFFFCLRHQHGAYGRQYDPTMNNSTFAKPPLQD